MIFIFLSVNSFAVLAENDDVLNSHESDPPLINYSLENHLPDKLIKVKNERRDPYFSIAVNQNINLGDEIDLAWSLSNSIRVNLSIYQNQTTSNFITDINRLAPISNNKSFNTFTSPTAILDANRNISGYKFGITSEIGIGNNYKLNLNFNYGQLEDANLVGFNNNEINTSSFALGIRNAKFGASLNTDVFLEDNVDFRDHSRLGIELDWHFSDDTTLSFGTKQRLNSNSYLDNSNSLDNLTGDVQYIKFKHNL